MCLHQVCLIKLPYIHLSTSVFFLFAFECESLLKGMHYGIILRPSDGARLELGVVVRACTV